MLSLKTGCNKHGDGEFEHLDYLRTNFLDEAKDQFRYSSMVASHSVSLSEAIYDRIYLGEKGKLNGGGVNCGLDYTNELNSPDWFQWGSDWDFSLHSCWQEKDVRYFEGVESKCCEGDLSLFCTDEHVDEEPYCFINKNGKGGGDDAPRVINDKNLMSKATFFSPEFIVDAGWTLSAESTYFGLEQLFVPNTPYGTARLLLDIMGGGLGVKAILNGFKFLKIKRTDSWARLT